MRILYFNSPLDPVAVGTDDDWESTDASVHNNQLVVPADAPDLYDYHLFIANASQLQNQAGLGDAKVVTEQLEEMIRVGCILILFVDGPTNLGWLPMKLNTRGGGGTETYVSEGKGMTEILTRYAAEMSYGTQLAGWSPLALAPNGHHVAVSYPYHQGVMLVLPRFERPHLVVRDILHHFIPDQATALTDRLGDTPIREDEPDWLKELELPGAAALKETINRLDERIGSLASEKDEKVDELGRLDKFLGLLFGTGENWLEPLVRDALALLGIEGGAERPIDFVHRIDDEQELWAEIEGSKGCIQVDKGGQLLRYLANEPERAAKVTGAIIGNPYRLQPPDGRPPAGSQGGLFSRPLVELAEKQGWALVTTKEIYDLLCLHLGGDQQAAAELRGKLRVPDARAASTGDTASGHSNLPG